MTAIPRKVHGILISAGVSAEVRDLVIAEVFSLEQKLEEVQRTLAAVRAGRDLVVRELEENQAS